MAWVERALGLDTLYMPGPRPADVELAESLGFRRLGNGSEEWSTPGTKELLRDFKPAAPARRFGFYATPYVSRLIHHVYHNAQGVPILWSCVAAVLSDTCACFGVQYALFTHGGCDFEAARHKHVHDHNPEPVPVESDKLEPQAALNGDGRAQFMIGMAHSSRIGSLLNSIQVLQALYNASTSNGRAANPEVLMEITKLKEQLARDEQEYTRFMDQCKEVRKLAAKVASNSVMGFMERREPK